MEHSGDGKSNSVLDCEMRKEGGEVVEEWRRDEKKERLQGMRIRRRGLEMRKGEAPRLKRMLTVGYPITL